MVKLKKYMHTINGRPAILCNKMLYLASGRHNFEDLFVNTLLEIRRQQKTDKEYRKNMEFKNKPQYGYFLIYVDKLKTGRIENGK